MQQASILATFFVFCMGATWLGLETGYFERQLEKAPVQQTVDAEPAAQA